MTFKAAKNFAQSKCRIPHALRKLRKKRARKASIVQADSKITFHTITKILKRILKNDKIILLSEPISTTGYDLF